ncbi:MAG TPA: protocatechuate 3,4-dioxygenase subunit beta [Beijerinckiaceae bacterium]|nr:protocatechuate 3,4-dioxygenase subunit beta [Beijerinckiaceae bacterium]
MASPAPFIRRDRLWHPPQFAPGYKTSVLRSPRRALLSLEAALGELSGPKFGHDMLAHDDNDLIRNHMVSGEAVGERIIVHGRVVDENARPVPGTLLEVWQANAGGKYRHVNDHYKAADDPNFGGCGRCITDADGHYYFRTIRPGPYPWRNNGSDWRPAHIHVSVFGEAFAQRLVTQMYFEGDPLIPLCPIVNTIPTLAARNMLIAQLDMGAMVPFDSLAYRFDIVLRGRRQAFFENRTEGL